MSGRRVLLLIVLLAACSKDEGELTQVMVVIDAEAQVQKRARDVDFEVRSGEGTDVEDWEVRLRQSITPGDDIAWPLEVALVPRAGDADRVYLVIATARDAKGEAIAEVRAISGYQKGKTVSLLLLFEDSCLDKSQTCNPEQTCRAGGCVDAHVDIFKLPKYERDEDGKPIATPFWTEDGGTDAAVGQDGGDAAAADAGDGGPGKDAAPPPADCTRDGDCDDGDPCNGAERCSRGECEAGESFECPALEDDPCRANVCVNDDGEARCEARAAREDESCRDGDATDEPSASCARDYVCKQGACEAQTVDTCEATEACQELGGCDADERLRLQTEGLRRKLRRRRRVHRGRSVRRKQLRLLGHAARLRRWRRLHGGQLQRRRMRARTLQRALQQGVPDRHLRHDCGLPVRAGAELQRLRRPAPADHARLLLRGRLRRRCPKRADGVVRGRGLRLQRLRRHQGPRRLWRRLCRSDRREPHRHGGLHQRAGHDRLRRGAGRAHAVHDRHDQRRASAAWVGSSTAAGQSPTPRSVELDPDNKSVKWFNNTFSAPLASGVPAFTNFRGMERHMEGPLFGGTVHVWLWGSDSTTTTTGRLARCSWQTCAFFPCPAPTVTCGYGSTAATAQYLGVVPYEQDGGNQTTYRGAVAALNRSGAGVARSIYSDGVSLGYTPTNAERDDSEGAWYGLLSFGFSRPSYVLAYGNGLTNLLLCTDTDFNGDPTCTAIVGLPNQGSRSYYDGFLSPKGDVLLLASSCTSLCTGATYYLVALAKGLDPTDGRNWKEFAISTSSLGTGRFATEVAAGTTTIMVLGGENGGTTQPYVFRFQP